MSSIITRSTLREIKLKNGEIIPAGEQVSLQFLQSNTCGTHYLQVTRKNGFVFKTLIFSYFFKSPTLRTLDKYSESGISRSVLGNKVEPDGVDSHGAPSWLLVFKLI